MARYSAILHLVWIICLVFNSDISSEHEIREELSVFPIWSGALSRAPESAHSVLFERVLNQLEMNSKNAHT